MDSINQLFSGWGSKIPFASDFFAGNFTLFGQAINNLFAILCGVVLFLLILVVVLIVCIAHRKKVRRAAQTKAPAATTVAKPAARDNDTLEAIDIDADDIEDTLPQDTLPTDDNDTLVVESPAAGNVQSADEEQDAADADADAAEAEDAADAVAEIADNTPATAYNTVDTADTLDDTAVADTDTVMADEAQNDMLADVDDIDIVAPVPAEDVQEDDAVEAVPELVDDATDDAIVEEVAEADVAAEPAPQDTAAVVLEPTDEVADNDTVADTDIIDEAADEIVDDEVAAIVPADTNDDTTDIAQENTDVLDEQEPAPAEDIVDTVDDTPAEAVAEPIDDAPVADEQPAVQEAPVDTPAEVATPQDDTANTVEQDAPVEQAVTDNATADATPAQPAVAGADSAAADTTEPAPKAAPKATTKTSKPRTTAKKSAPAKKTVATKEETMNDTTAKETKKVIGSYEITLCIDGYRFMLYANNKQLLYESTGFTTVDGALKGIETFRKTVADATPFVTKDKYDRYRYIFNKRYQGENYSTKAQAAKCAESVKRFAPDAKVVVVDPTPEELATYNQRRAAQRTRADVDWDAIAKEEAAAKKMGKLLVADEVIDGEIIGYRYYMIANNGQILYTSAIYASAKTALSGIDAFKRAIYIGNLYIDVDKFGRYRYIVRGEGNSTYMGESYTTKAQAESSAQSIRKFAACATIIPYEKKDDAE